VSGWSRRIRHQAEVPSLHEAKAAAQNLAERVGFAPGKARVIFETVADVALLGTVLVSGALATVHLYKAFFARHKENQPAPEPAGNDRSPPHRRGRHATAAAHDRGGHDEDSSRSR
jgi:hypothetical protein